MNYVFTSYCPLLLLLDYLMDIGKPTEAPSRPCGWFITWHVSLGEKPGDHVNLKERWSDFLAVLEKAKLVWKLVLPSCFTTTEKDGQGEMCFSVIVKKAGL